MSRKQLGTWIAVVAFGLLVTGAAALVIEDSGRNPYRTYQKTGSRPLPKPIDPSDGIHNIVAGDDDGHNIVLGRHGAPAKPPPADPAWGALRGRVVWRGELPEVKSFVDDIKVHVLSKHYLSAPKEHLLDPTWKIDAKTKGIANVVVFLKPVAADGVLPLHPDDKKRSDQVVLDAPHCNYVPHVTALYPEWRLGNERERTGEKFFITCSSKEGPGFFFEIDVHPLQNNPVSLMLRPGQKTELFLKPQNRPMIVKDFFRPWMKAYIWAFGHPYFAVTAADGAFTMPRVPAGIKLRALAWHEAHGWLHGKDGRIMTFDSDNNRWDFEMERAADSSPPNPKS